MGGGNVGIRSRQWHELHDDGRCRQFTPAYPNAWKGLRHQRRVVEKAVHGPGRRVVDGRRLAALTKQAGQVVDDILANEHHDLFVNSIFPQLKDLGANVVRVYQVHPAHSHDKSMKILDEHNIYVMVGLATSDHSIKQMTGGI